MPSMSKNITNSQIPSYVARRAEFTSNSGHAENVTWTWSQLVGRLPQRWSDKYRSTVDAAREAGDSVYVVFSYNTPVAWFYDGVWTVPAVKYSVTTSKFQGLVRTGIRDGGYTDEIVTEVAA